MMNVEMRFFVNQAEVELSEVPSECLRGFLERVEKEIKIRRQSQEVSSVSV